MMDQDGLSIALALAAFAILFHALWTGRLDIQFLHLVRARQPLAYWLCAVALLLIGLEASRRAVFVGCAEC
jgi:hypothetical protein